MERHSEEGGKRASKTAHERKGPNQTLLSLLMDRISSLDGAATRANAALERMEPLEVYFGGQVEEKLCRLILESVDEEVGDGGALALVGTVASLKKHADGQRTERRVVLPPELAEDEARRAAIDTLCALRLVHSSEPAPAAPARAAWEALVDALLHIEVHEERELVRYAACNGALARKLNGVMHADGEGNDAERPDSVAELSYSELGPTHSPPSPPSPREVGPSFSPQQARRAREAFSSATLQSPSKLWRHWAAELSALFVGVAEGEREMDRMRAYLLEACKPRGGEGPMVADDMLTSQRSFTSSQRSLASSVSRAKSLSAPRPAALLSTSLSSSSPRISSPRPASPRPASPRSASPAGAISDYLAAIGCADARSPALLRRLASPASIPRAPGSPFHGMDGDASAALSKWCLLEMKRSLQWCCAQRARIALLVGNIHAACTRTRTISRMHAHLAGEAERRWLSQQQERLLAVDEALAAWASLIVLEGKAVAGSKQGGAAPPWAEDPHPGSRRIAGGFTTSDVDRARWLVQRNTRMLRAEWAACETQDCVRLYLPSPRRPVGAETRPAAVWRTTEASPDWRVYDNGTLLVSRRTLNVQGSHKSKFEELHYPVFSSWLVNDDDEANRGCAHRVTFTLRGGRTDRRLGVYLGILIDEPSADRSTVGGGRSRCFVFRPTDSWIFCSHGARCPDLDHLPDDLSGTWHNADLPLLPSARASDAPVSVEATLDLVTRKVSFATEGGPPAVVGLLPQRMRARPFCTIFFKDDSVGISAAVEHVEFSSMRQLSSRVATRTGRGGGGRAGSPARASSPLSLRMRELAQPNMQRRQEVSVRQLLLDEDRVSARHLDS